MFAGEVEWLVYDFPDKRFSDRQTLVRLRKLGETTQLTIKQLLDTTHAKVAEETEIETNSYTMTDTLLRILGLIPKKGYPLKKHRVSYALGEIHFELDSFLHVPTYLEIEAPNQLVLDEYVIALGFTPEDAKPWGTREVFAYYTHRTTNGDPSLM